MEENNVNNKNDGNISIPKPLFAILIIVLAATMCYAAYNTGYMKGMAKAGPSEVPFKEAPSEPQPPADDAPGEGFDKGNIFRDFTPFGSGENDNNEAKNEERSEGGFLDIVAATVSDEAKETYNIPSGVLIMKVSKDGAAEKAGIKDHSVITSVDGKEISTIDGLKAFLAEKKPGDTVSVTLYEPSDNHGFTKRSVSVTLSDGEAVSKEQ